MADVNTPSPPARPAFHGLLAPVPAPPVADGPGVFVREVAEPAILFISARSGQSPTLQEKVSAAIGLDLPGAGLRTEHGGVSALSIAPDQWLVMQERGGEDRLQPLHDACRGLAALVEVGDGRAVLEVSGPRARDALAKGVAIDLHPRAFGPGRVASTMASLIDVTLCQIDDAPTFQLILYRSLAGSFWHWLAEASAEFGLALAPQR